MNRNQKRGGTNTDYYLPLCIELEFAIQKNALASRTSTKAVNLK